MATKKTAAKKTEQPPGKIRGKPWSDEELRASVAAYLEMQHKVKNNEPINKSTYYRTLGEKFGRDADAYGRRMQNISWVLEDMGREWLKGLAPNENVGPTNRPRIELLIRELTAPATAVAPLPFTPPHTTTMLAVEQKRAPYHVTRKPPPKPAGVAKPKRMADSDNKPQYERDMEVRAWVLFQANAHCECCGAAAPFISDNGEPYLEIHHVRQLAHGGPDTPENAVAVCPNCHRKLHFGDKNGSFRARLYAQVARLVPA